MVHKLTKTESVTSVRRARFFNIGIYIVIYDIIRTHDGLHAMRGLSSVTRFVTRRDTSRHVEASDTGTMDEDY